MKRNLLRMFSLVLALAFVAIVGCATTKNAGTAVKEGTTAAGKEVGKGAEVVGEKVEDASITSAVKMKFANDQLVSASNINVDTTDGIVTLTGTVANQAEMDRAMQLGRSVNGVNSVHSNLTMSRK